MVDVDDANTKAPSMTQHKALEEKVDDLKKALETHEQGCAERNQHWDDKWDEDQRRLYDKIDEKFGDLSADIKRLFFYVYCAIGGIAVLGVIATIITIYKGVV